jgi:hypothetical protein
MYGWMATTWYCGSPINILTTFANFSSKLHEFINLVNDVSDE